MARNCLELRKKLKLSELYRLSQELAFDYSNSSVSGSILMERYNLTESAYYNLLEMSITHSLVDDKTVKIIRKKILDNQAAHGNRGSASNKKYDMLEKQRKKHSAFSKKDIAYIAKYYANHPEYSKQQVSKTFRFQNTTVLDQVLKRACLELIISDEVFYALRKRATANAENLDYTNQFFDALAQARAKAKSLKKKSRSAC